MSSSVSLFSVKENCCGCSACMNTCPKNAISMKEDEYGFVYPHIDDSVCVGCGACTKVCAFQNSIVNNEPIKTYAACAKDKEILNISASGGAFATLAIKTIAEDGIVYGAAFDKELNVNHIGIESSDDLKLLQGSKYVQSNIGIAYKQVKNALKKGRKVLFSGTPCQVDGLYGYLGEDDEKLLTVDLVCHGEPNQKMFKDYVKSLGNVNDFTFRDKALGWGINGKARLNNKKEIKLWQSASPYIYYFTQGMIYRSSCYKCKYACKNRPADITLGDYWGIEKQHPDYLHKKLFDTKNGISVVIANTDKGLKSIDSCIDSLNIKESTFEKASAGNAQLVRPSKCPESRSEILEVYSNQGWSGVNDRFNKNIGIRRYSSYIKSKIPIWLKNYIKGK